MSTTLRIRCSVAAVATLIVVAQPARAIPLSTAFTYQGDLKQNGVPANGPVNLVFTLWDEPGAGDPPIGGTQVGIEVTKNGTPLDQGAFTVQLNELNQFGASAFTGAARWLQVSVNGTLLTPRQPISATPYALSLRPGAHIDGGPAFGVEFASPATQMGLQAWSPNYAVYGGATGTGVGVFGGGHYGVWGQGNAMGVRGIGLIPEAWAGYFEGKSFFSDKVGIGTEIPNAKLEISSSCQLGPCPDLLRLTNLFDGANSRTLILNSSSINASGSSASLPLYINDQTAGHVALANGGGKVGVGIWPPTQKLDVAGTVRSSLGGFMFPDGTVQTTAALGGPNFWSAGGDDIFNLNTGRVGIGFSAPGAMLDVRRPGDTGYVYPVARFSTIQPRVTPARRSDITFNYTSINATSETDGIPEDATLRLNDTSSGDVLMASGGGRVGIGILPYFNGVKLHVVGQTTGVRGEATDASSFGVYGTSPDTGVFGYGETGVEGWASSASGYGGVFGNNLFPNAMKTLGDVHMLLGNVGIGTSSPNWPLDIEANQAVTRLVSTTTNNGSVLELRNNTPFASSLGAINFNDPAGDTSGQIAYKFVAERMTFRVGGVEQMEIRADGTTSVKVLEITGADVAEKFPVSDARDAIKPGMVMEIDPTNAGKLRIASGAYNRRVAGVVSGAGDIPAGAILGNLPGSENAPAIALSGRVWVHCDASTGAIEPGDLLTTSDAPGHAMKVIDFPRAQGAIIGKAMTPLASGDKGLVLVLVNLQ